MIRPLMFQKLLPLCLAVTALLCGCATQTYAPDQAPEYMIIRDYTPFYANGPLQVNGPDATLRTETRVKLLRQEMGYSLVQMESLRTGYIANENMTPAPPRPPQPKIQESASTTGNARNRRKNSTNSPRYTGEQNNDIPLPDANVPPPDLNVGPEDIPTGTPPASEAPIEKPKFRL